MSLKSNMSLLAYILRGKQSGESFKEMILSNQIRLLLD